MKEWRIKFSITPKQAYIFLFSLIAFDLVGLAIILVSYLTKVPASLYHK